MHENGTQRGLEEDVFARVAELEFLRNLFVEIVCGVFRFPHSMDETKAIEQRAIWGDLRADFGFQRKLRNELPFIGASFVDMSCAVFEQCLEGGSDGSFVRHAEFRELVE